MRIYPLRDQDWHSFNTSDLVDEQADTLMLLVRGQLEEAIVDGFLALFE
jgi:hypothetical protein